MPGSDSSAKDLRRAKLSSYNNQVDCNEYTTSKIEVDASQNQIESDTSSKSDRTLSEREDSDMSDVESEIKADVHYLRGSTAVSNLASYF